MTNDSKMGLATGAVFLGAMGIFFGSMIVGLGNFGSDLIVGLPILFLGAVLAICGIKYGERSLVERR